MVFIALHKSVLKEALTANASPLLISNMSVFLMAATKLSL